MYDEIIVISFAGPNGHKMSYKWSRLPVFEKRDRAHSPIPHGAPIRIGSDGLVEILDKMLDPLLALAKGVRAGSQDEENILCPTFCVWPSIINV